MKGGDADEFIDYLMDAAPVYAIKDMSTIFRTCVPSRPAEVAGEHREIPLDKRTV